MSHAHDAHAHGPIPANLPKHEFLAGRIALDFCNSLSRMRRIGPPDRILSPEESLLRVAQRAAERGDWPGEERALRELRALRLRK